VPISITPSNCPFGPLMRRLKTIAHLPLMRDTKGWLMNKPASPATWTRKNSWFFDEAVYGCASELKTW